MPTIKSLAIVIGLSSSLFAAGIHAEAPPAPAKPPVAAPMSTMPHAPMQGGAGMKPPAMPAGQHPPMNGPAGQGGGNQVAELQLTDAQKGKMVEWRKVQQQHMQETMNNQEMVEDLAAADKLDQDALKNAADKMAEETRQYYLDYAQKNHDFMASLNPDQRTKMVELRKQRKEQMKQMREQMRQQMMEHANNASQAGSPASPAPAAAPPAKP